MAEAHDDDPQPNKLTNSLTCPDGSIWNKEKWPLAGPFLCRASIVVSIVVATMLDDHHSVRVAMAPPAFMPAVIAMFAELGTRAVAGMMTAALDHDGLGAGNRRCRNRDRAKRRDD